jgi:peptidoglycan L-alanyl-D-glutamate endopeptidase CwlK
VINSRDLHYLHPIVRTKCEQFISECKKQGIIILITSTYRDIESQNALYAQGRTTAGKKVTNAKGGQSFHNYRVAFDFVPLVNGKAVWNDKELFNKCGEIGESLGLEWAGRWKSFKELAHFQLTNGLTLKDFRAGKTL